MDEANALEKEREWHALFRDIQKQGEWFNAKSLDQQVQLMFRWFPYENNIEVFVEDLKAGKVTNVAGIPGSGQQNLFV